MWVGLSYLYRMDETLVECQCNDTEGVVPNTGIRMEERLQHLLQVELHDGAAHPRGYVPHLFEILLLRLLLPWKNKDKNPSEEALLIPSSCQTPNMLS